MRFTQDFLASLREAVPLSQVIGRVVSWDRRKSQPGKGDHWACCPFHEEKTPSFHVDDRKGFYHCFGCHASGDHIRFLMDHQGLDFPDAVKSLAETAGVAIPDAPRVDSRRERERRVGRSALEAAQDLYTATFWSGDGRAARAYAHQRGLSEHTLETFGIGLSPPTAGVVSRHLKAEGFSDGDLEQSGLAVRSDRGGLRDRFRARLMVPIHDARGRIVGFGGRTLDGGEPKYLNSPETPLFNKSELLYNAHRARGAAHRANRLFVVEGYMDAIALAQAGIETVVASLGTALTEAQIKLAWQMADEPVLCFDGDQAGRGAASRALDRIVPLLTAGKSFQLLALPQGQDPDDVVSEGGAAAFEALAGKATPLVNALFEREAEAGTQTPERMAALEARLDRIAGAIEDGRLSDLYRRAFRDKLFELRRAGRQSARPSGRQQNSKLPTPPLASRGPIAPPAGEEHALLELERLVLGLMIREPTLMERYGERLSALRFAVSAHQGFCGYLLEAYQASLATGAGEIIAALPAPARMCLSEIWGPTDDPAGPRLKERFSILAYSPDQSFIAQCADVFLKRLEMRQLATDLTVASGAVATGGNAAESRLLSLSAVVETEQLALAEAERILADRATALRRASSRGAPDRPGGISG
ncbi:MAG: DNA primase [Pseudomonadota bacterium]